MPQRRNACLLSLALIAPLFCGCYQPVATTSPLTPVNPASAQLAPVSATSPIGPFGGRTRIPPPATGSFLVPNNYLGGSSGQLGANLQQPLGRSVAGSVQPASYPPVGTGNFANYQYQPSVPVNIQRPSLNGMRTHDLTTAPSPPGYFGPSLPARQILVQQPTNQPVTIASNQPIARNAFPTPSPSPVAQVSAVQPVTNPAWQDNTQHRAMQPSTDPIPTRDPNLTWRRPGSGF